MSSETQEAAVLENIVPQLEADGFEVITHPSRHRLPPFMQSYTPDAIALRRDKNLAIEVLRKGSSSEKSLDQLRELLVGHRDWELRVYWISPSNTPEPIEQAAPKEIGQAIERIERLASEGRPLDGMGRVGSCRSCSGAREDRQTANACSAYRGSCLGRICNTLRSRPSAGACPCPQ